MTGGGLLVAGTTSDAGKSVVTAGICRWLYRKGISVAPFKAQNMSNNSMVVFDAEGRSGEIGRAQALQAAACGLEPSVRFNPVLLKPGSDHSSQVVVLGVAEGSVNAATFHRARHRLREVAWQTLASLREDYDVVICEGAGSPAEINLRAGDYVNMGLARAADLPVVVVADIDRGGVFASLFGTVALLEAADQALVSGFVINKFRGDQGLLAPGVAELTELTGRPTLGVLPWAPDVWIDGEDSLAFGTVLGRPRPPTGREWLRVAAVRLPRLSNATDLEALAAEPGVLVRLTREPSEIADADVVVLPGSKATVDDLRWLRRTGLAEAICAHAAVGRPVFGICGGFQMLGRQIHDHIESGQGTVDGLGLLPVDIVFAEDKVLARPTGVAMGVPVNGYEIHHGRISARAEDLEPLIRDARGNGEGAVRGPVFGTHWHGIMECDAFRRIIVGEFARLAGRQGFAVCPDTSYAALRDRTVDLLGDLVEEHLDTAMLLRLIEEGPRADMPALWPGASRVPTPQGEARGRPAGAARDR